MPLRIAQRFATTVIAIAAIIGIIAFAVAEKNPWIAIVSIGAAAAIVGLGELGPILWRYLARLSHYPILQDQYAQSQQRILDLEAQLADAPARVARSVNAGRTQVVGAILAAGILPSPVITSVALEGDRLIVAAHRASTTPVPIGARFSLVVVGVGRLLGILSVVGVNPDDDTKLVLECAEEVVPEFWERLRTEAAMNPAPPGGVELSPYQLGSLPGLEDLPSNLMQPTAARRRRNAH
jgi:hypothetical protein